MPHLEVLIGIPGSGKTTYARRQCARRPTVRLISPDLVREALYPGYAHGQVDQRHIDDHTVFRIAYRQVAEALEAGASVIFDATSLTPRRRRKLILLAQRHNARVTARFFPIPLREALHRNHQRARQVPPGVIAHMARVLVPPAMEEGFDAVIVNRSHRDDGLRQAG